MIPSDALIIITVLLLILALFVVLHLHYYRRCPACHSRMKRRKGRVRWKCTADGCGYTEFSGEQL